MRHLTYLASIFMICVPTLLIVWKRQQRILKKYELLLLIVGLLGLPFAATEGFALQWRAWEYGTQTTLHIYVGAELETYLFAAGIFVCVAAVTIVSVVRTDRATARHRSKRPTAKTHKKRAAPRRPIYAHTIRKSV